MGIVAADRGRPCPAPGPEVSDLSVNELWGLDHHFHQTIHLGFGVIEVKTRMRSGLDTEFSREWLSAMMAPTQGPARLVGGTVMTSGACTPSRRTLTAPARPVFGPKSRTPSNSESRS